MGSLLALPPQTKGTPVCQGFPSLVLENYASSKILGILPPSPSQPLKQWNCRQGCPTVPSSLLFYEIWANQPGLIVCCYFSTWTSVGCNREPHLPCTTDIFLRRLGPNIMLYPDVRPSWAPVSPSLLQQSLGATLSQLSLVCLLHLHYPHEMPWVGTLLPPSVGVLSLIFWPL